MKIVFTCRGFRLTLHIDVFSNDDEYEKLKRLICLFKVFRGKREACWKITAFHINTIVQLVAVHTTRAPQLLWLLHAIVKLEDVSMVLKKNQAAVMKSFIQSRAKIAHIIDDNNRNM